MIQATLEITIAEKLEIRPQDVQVLAARLGRIVCRASTPRCDVVAMASNSLEEFQR